MADIHDEMEDVIKRIEKLETQMAFLQRSLGVTDKEIPKTDASENVSMLIKKGGTIGAIKAFREETGASLKDAKSFVESVLLIGQHNS